MCPESPTTALLVFYPQHLLFLGQPKWSFSSFQVSSKTMTSQSVLVPLSCLPNGVSQWHSSPVDVDFCRVNVQHLDVGQHDHAEGLVDLPHGDIILLQPCCIQDLTDKHMVLGYSNRYAPINKVACGSGQSTSFVILVKYFLLFWTLIILNQDLWKIRCVILCSHSCYFIVSDTYLINI